MIVWIKRNSDGTFTLKTIGEIGEKGTIVSEDILKKLIQEKKIKVANAKMDKSGRIITEQEKYDNFCKNYRTKLIRTIKNNNGTYTLIDFDGNKNVATAIEIKNLLRTKKIGILDLQIDRAGRLVSKKVEFAHVCRRYHLANGHIQMLEWEEVILILQYGLARLQQLSVARKNELIKLMIKINCLDSNDFISMIKDTSVWNINKYQHNDTQFRDRIIDFMYYLSGTKNEREHNMFWYPQDFGSGNLNINADTFIK